MSLSEQTSLVNSGILQKDSKAHGYPMVVRLAFGFCVSTH